MKNSELNELYSDDAEVKYHRAKKLIEISKETPKELYKHFDIFVELLDSEKNVMKWTGTIVIGNLAKIDKDNKVEKVLNKLFKLLKHEMMITAGNAVNALGEIALAKPKLANKITTELLKVEGYKYETDQCHHITMGKVILAFEKYFTEMNEKNQEKVFVVVRKLLENPRKATAKKAERFFKKYAFDAAVNN